MAFLNIIQTLDGEANMARRRFIYHQPVLLCTLLFLLYFQGLSARGNDSLKVTFERVSIQDTTFLGGMRGGFPFPVLSIITVQNQKNSYIHGLADTSRWLFPGDTTQLGLPVDSVWSRIWETHQEDVSIPSMPDVKSLAFDTTWMVTEVENLEGYGVSVAMAMDYSTSMGTGINAAEDAARTFIRQKNDLDRVALIKFNGGVRVFQTFTADTIPLMEDIPKKPDVVSGTALYDALYEAITLCEGEPWRSAVMAYTDGRDNSSTRTIQEVIDHANERKVPIFMIGLGGRLDVDVLTQLADSTGGVYKHAQTAEDLEAIYLSVYGLIRGFYILATRSTDPFTNGTTRLVDIDVLYQGVLGRGVGTYQVPLIPPDVGIHKSAVTDSLSSEGRYLVFPEDTISYTLTVTNHGPGLAGLVRITDLFPDSMAFLDSFQPPDTVTVDSVVWTIPMLRVNESVQFQYRAVAHVSVAPWEEMPMVNTARVSCELDANPSNDTVSDTVYVMGRVFPKPEIILFPKHVASGDPVNVEVRSPVRVKRWDLHVLHADGSQDTVYADSFIAMNTLIPDEWLSVVPPITDTAMRTSGKEERVIVTLYTWGFWGEIQSDTAHFTIRSVNNFLLDKNTYFPDDGTGLDLRFRLSSNRNARIKIYDLSGAFIVEPVDGPYPAGWNSHIWDGRDEKGRLIGSGTYVAILTSGAFQKARKFIVIR
ncbi:MAG TPA: VWA domain-containing protein [bacterium]|nr:VWA domain-containing protein [bacterium]